MKMKSRCNTTVYSLWLTNSEMTPHDPDLWVFTSLYNSFPLTANRTCDMLVTDRIWQRWCDVTPIMLYKTLYRHASFYCFILLCLADKNCIFLQTEDLWRPCIKRAYQHYFSNSIYSICNFVSCFGNSHNISNF